MTRKATHVYADLNPDSRPFTLSPLAIEDLTDEPVFALTPEASAVLQGQTLLDALTAFDWRPGELAKDFQAAKDAYSVVMAENDHDAFMKAQDEFNHACRNLFFALHTMIRNGGASC